MSSEPNQGSNTACEVGIDNQDPASPSKPSGDDNSAGDSASTREDVDAAGGACEAEEEDEATAAVQRQYGTVSMIAPEGCIAITEDGAVLKKVLEPGEGEQPPRHASCLIHYVGWLADSGRVFMDTRRDTDTQQPVPVVAGRNSAAQETGLSMAAATMAKGEVALVYVQDPVYGYGERGSFSFPAVPPRSRLVYRVEMVSWETAEETDGDRGSLLYEERIERAERRRLAGNELFQQGLYKQALAKYAMSLSYLDEDFMFQLEGRYLEKAEEIKIPIHLNMAAAQIKINDYNTAIYNCSQVITMQPGNVKALFRRGKAKHALGRTEEAMEDLEAAIKKDPNDKGILAEMHAVKATMWKEREAEAKLFKGRFKATNPEATTSSGQAQAASASPYMRVSTSEIEPAAQQPKGPLEGRRPELQGVRKGPLVMMLLVLSWLWSALLRSLGLRHR